MYREWGSGQAEAIGSGPVGFTGASEGGKDIGGGEFTDSSSKQAARPKVKMFEPAYLDPDNKFK